MQKRLQVSFLLDGIKTGEVIEYEGKMLKLYQENNVIEQISKLINIA